MHTDAAYKAGPGRGCALPDPIQETRNQARGRVDAAAAYRQSSSTTTSLRHGVIRELPTSLWTGPPPIQVLPTLDARPRTQTYSAPRFFRGQSASRLGPAGRWPDLRRDFDHARTQGRSICAMIHTCTITPRMARHRAPVAGRSHRLENRHGIATRSPNVGNACTSIVQRYQPSAVPPVPYSPP